MGWEKEKRESGEGVLGGVKGHISTMRCFRSLRKLQEQVKLLPLTHVSYATIHSSIATLDRALLAWNGVQGCSLTFVNGVYLSSRKKH